MTHSGEGRRDRPLGHVEAALDEALAKEGTEREAFIRSLAEQPDLAKEVESLLSHVETGESWFRGAARWLRPPTPAPPPPPEEDPLVGATFERYEVVRVLGRGGMGVVYQARDTKLDRKCALKFLAVDRETDPGERDRLVHEAKVVAAIDHPNVCTIYEVGEADDGRLFLAMPYYEGRTLKSLLASDAALPPGFCAHVTLQLARALSVAHAAGIVHRDVKPANVVMTGRGVVKLLDFGVAVRQERPSRGVPRPAGTLAYMSPEQLAGVEIDHRADLWSLGVVLWEMLTGRRPFTGESTVELIDAIDLEAPEIASPDPTDAGHGSLLELARRLMSKDVGERPDQADAVVEVLRDYLRAHAEMDPTDGATDAWQHMQEVAARKGANGDLVSATDDRTWSGSFGRSLRSLIFIGVAAWIVGSAAWSRLVEGGSTSGLPQSSLNIPAVGLSAGWSWIALSPDGRYLAFQGPRGQPFRIRDLETDVVWPLPGTEGGLVPFFSPDGAKVGFMKGTALMAVPTNGGSPASSMMELVPFWPFVTWVGDHELVVADNFDGLFRFSLDDAGVVIDVNRLTSVTEHGHAAHNRPGAIPGTRAVVFQVRYQNGTFGIAVADLDTGQTTEIESRGRSPRYAAGHVVFSFQGNLWALPFDPETLEATGESRSLGLPVNLRPRAADFDVSADGRLAFVRPHDMESRLVSVERSGDQRRFSRALDSFSDPRFSPGGDRIAFATEDVTPGRRLWTLDAATGQLTGLTEEGGLDPRWSNDGDSLFFTRSVVGQGYVVYKRASDGSGGDRLILPGSRRLEDASAAGRWVVLSDGPTRTRRARDLETGRDVEIAPVWVGAAALAPNGRYVAYPLPRPEGEILTVAPFPDADPSGAVSVGPGYAPRWGARGSKLYYRDGTYVMELTIDTTAARFTVLTRDTLFIDRWDRAAGYDVHPDGQSFVFVDPRVDSATVIVGDLPGSP